MPAEAKTGNVVVAVGGVQSNGVKFAVGAVPVIKNLSATSGPVGTPITITGTNFGPPLDTSTVKFGTIPGKPTKWTDTSIEVSVPTGAKTGNVVVMVGSIPSSGTKFTIP